MKQKQIIITFLAILCNVNIIIGQDSRPCWWTPDWKWTNSNSSNWDAQILGTVAHMGSPFTGDRGNAETYEIARIGDYLPEQGWVLLSKDFGCIAAEDVKNKMPIFMLYNKYRSIIRVFYYVAQDGSYRGANAYLNWLRPNDFNNSLLTHSNKYPKANNQYPLKDQSGSFNNNEKIFTTIPKYETNGGWCMAEYLVNFDPNTSNDPDRNDNFAIDLTFTVDPYVESTVSLAGDVKLFTRNATAKEIEDMKVEKATNNPQNPNALDYTLMAQDYLGKVPSEDDLKKNFDKIAKTTANLDDKFCKEFTRKLAEANYYLENGTFKKALLGISEAAEGVGGVFGVVACVLDVFMDKSNTNAQSTPQYLHPLVSQGSLNLNGTITTLGTSNQRELQLPGCRHKRQSSDENPFYIGLGYYDCPLGTVSLQEAPAIEVRTFQEPQAIGKSAVSAKFGLYNFNNSFYPPKNDFNQVFLGSDQHYSYYKRTVSCLYNWPSHSIKSYKVTGDVKLALNGAAGLKILSTQAALAFEIMPDGNGNPQINLLDNGSQFKGGCFPDINAMYNVLRDNGTPAGGDPYFIRDPGVGNGDGDWIYKLDAVYSLESFHNYAQELLNNGTLQLTSYDPKGFHKFQTPFIDLEKFKNTSIKMQAGAKVLLKLLITMKPTDPNADQTPVVYIATYEIPQGNISESMDNVPYEMTCEQLKQSSLLTRTISGVKAENNYFPYTINNETISSGKIIAGSASSSPNDLVFAYGNASLAAALEIDLKPGFSTNVVNGGGTVNLYIQEGKGCIYGTNAKVIDDSYFRNCTNPQTAGRGGLNEEQVADKKSNFNLMIAPNPAQSIINLTFSEKSDGLLQVTDLSGREVHIQELKDSESYIIDFRDRLAQGVYVVKFVNEQNTVTQKLIIN